MSQAISLNKDGSVSVYLAGKRQWIGPVSELVAYLSGPTAPLPKPKAKKTKPPSRSARWGNAASAAAVALNELKEIQEEFSDWKDNLPENLQSSTLGEKLDVVCDLDIDGALGTAEEAEYIDLPLGFGRD